MKYKCLATGSLSNCHLLIGASGRMLILDCGIPFRELSLSIDSFKNIDVVLYSHVHLDHFKGIPDLEKRRIKVFGVHNLEIGKQIVIGEWEIIPIGMWHYDDKGNQILWHNVPCISFLIRNTIEKKIIYFATDTNNLPRIVSKEFDLLLIETNYDKTTLTELMALGEIEHLGFEWHMSLEDVENWLVENFGLNCRHRNIVVHHLSKSHANPKIIKERLTRYADNVYIAEKNLMIEV